MQQHFAKASFEHGDFHHATTDFLRRYDGLGKEIPFAVIQVRHLLRQFVELRQPDRAPGIGRSQRL
ncbi:hypothetical protein D3C72_2601760 [compost metagenome]